jgi:hypothetical protein
MPFVFEGQAKRDVLLAVWQIASKIDGTWTGERERAPRETPFSSPTHALRVLLVNRCDGYAMANISDPGRLEAHAGQVTGGGPKRAPGESRATDLAEQLAIVDRALQQAYDVPTIESESIGRPRCEYILLARYVGGRSPADLADRLADDGILVTPDRVSRVTRYGMRRIAAPIERAGLVPRYADQTDGSDLFGWKEIGAHLGISVSTAQRWQTRLGMPVRFVRIGTGFRVEASSEQIDRWKAARTVTGAA